MKLEQFFEKFELFADAPNAVAKMRELVSDLAVTGRLVEQLESDGTTRELLQNARSERLALVAARKIRTRTPAPFASDEPPFDIPENWQWARLSDVGFELGQKVPDRRFTYIDVGSIDSDRGQISDRVEALEPKNAPSRARKLVAPGTVIYSTVRPYLLNIAIVPHHFAHEPIASTAFGILHPFSGINNRFLFYWLRSSLFTAYVQAGMKGMAYPAINDEKFYAGYIPVPPTAEQERIVAKVDELMALCDRLEAQQQEREARHAALARAALARFAEAPTPANLDFLFHPSYAITPADLRKTILNLAVQGKLVQQGLNDGNAHAEIGRAIEKRKQTTKARGLRRKKLDESADDMTVQEDLPTSWCVERLANLVDPVATISYGVLVPGNDVAGGVPFVRAQDLCLSDHPTRPNKTIAPEIERSYARTRLSGGEILLCVVGSIGKIGTVPETWAGANIARAVARIKPIPQVLRDFLLLALQASAVQDYFRSSTRTLAQPTLNVGMIEQTPIPVPPLAEQRRIVAKVAQLMAIVDQLETQLAEAKTKSTALLDAVIHELLNPSAEIVDLAAYRAAIGCYAIRKMQDKPYFGRTAAMKLFYLAQAHVGLELGLKPMRDAAGPLDQWIYDFEKDGAREDWFRVSESNIANGWKKIAYQPGRMLAAPCVQAERMLSTVQRKEFDRLLGLFSDKTTEEAEIIATLFAAWNDFLIDGHSPSDDQIVTEVREHWHEKKARFTPTLLRQWLAWLRENDLVPKGRLPHTVHQPRLLH